jgi:4'-phosphopantetheinyl transferase
MPLWKIPQSELMLVEKDIHIWQADLDLTIIDIQKLYRTLSIDERVRAERFRFEKDRRRFIARRGILRTILGSYLAVKAGELPLCQRKNGKPEIADRFGEGTLHFNLSHSNGIALFAFARDSEVGVDIEYKRDIPEMEQIVERFFSKRENEVFRSLSACQKRDAFFNCWTCKEAFVKALGEGLSWPLDKFEVSLVPGEPAKLVRVEGDSREASHWSIQDLSPAPNHAGAFAAKKNMFEMKYWQWAMNLN